MCDVSIILVRATQKSSIEVLIPRLIRFFFDYNLKGEIVLDSNITNAEFLSIVDNWSKDYPIVMSHSSKLSQSFDSAKGEVIACLDASLAYSTNCLPDIVMPVLRRDCSLCVGSRFSRHGLLMDASLLGQLGVMMGHFFTTPVTQFSDSMSRFFAFRRSALGVELPTFSYPWILLTLLCHTTVLNAREVPVVYRSSTSYLSRLADVLTMMPLLLKLYVTSIFRYVSAMTDEAISFWPTSNS